MLGRSCTNQRIIVVLELFVLASFVYSIMYLLRSRQYVTSDSVQRSSRELHHQGPVMSSNAQHALANSNTDFDRDRRMSIVDSDVYRKRRRTVSEFCQHNRAKLQMKDPEDQLSRRVHIVWRHELVYCEIEKIGSTFWLALLEEARKIPGARKDSLGSVIIRPEFIDKISHPRDVFFDELHYVLPKFTKFLFVRNPYHRLLSGYVDKLFIPNTVFRPIGTDVIDHFRPNASKKIKQCGHDATFPEFLKHVYYAMTTGDHRDRHFVPMFDHCRPCEMNYDIIGRMESFKDDVAVIAKSRGIENLVNIADFTNSSEVADIKDMIEWMYTFSGDGRVRKCMSFHDIKLRYWKKLQIKGLIHRDINIPIDVLNNEHIAEDDFIKVALEARSRSGPRNIRIKNRILALREAFQSVPQQDIEKYLEVFGPDFEIFGYNKHDSEIFGNKWHKGESSFFDVPMLQG